ncbi:hypothetical protein KC19_3G141000 [Ceratodon purpureus]|uniref:AB hydrolase-1 domain-containing protein n=1 Tax=Ceratodon purpureus TaxID=3225 RepID=A0A8T0IKE5_CERPU|nr:hypothetical protein KC19_3G141000 [Ceratodon purpureus]
MAEPVRKPRISAASARSHTRRDAPRRGPGFPGFVRRLVMLVGVVVGSMIFKMITPPPGKVLNGPDGIKVTAPRIETRDGRYLAYREVGVRKERARHYIVHVHGYGGSRLDTIAIPAEVMNELSLYVVSFDRAGYGQSDPNPKRSLKSDVEDVEDLADGIGLRPKFYVIASSIGSYVGWGLLKYKPERLAGVAFTAPMVNYWWPGFPKSEMAKAWGSQRTGDKMSYMVAHYLPSFTFWYNMVQKRLPRSVLESEDGNLAFNERDQEAIKMLPTIIAPEHYKEATQQGTYESKAKDWIIMNSDWAFTPMSLENPFDIPVHIWQGSEDSLVPANLQRHVASSLPWVKYHELEGEGHLLDYYSGFPEKMVRTLQEDSNQKDFTL